MLYRMYFSNQVWTSNNIRNAKIANISETCDYNSNALVFGSVEKSTSSDYTVRVTRAAITNSISLNVSDLRDNAMNYCEDDHSLMPDSRVSEQTSVAPTETPTLRTTVENEDHRIVS